MFYDGRKPGELTPLGETRVPSVTDLFVAMMQPAGTQSKEAA
jgi:hypothetical protein